MCKSYISKPNLKVNVSNHRTIQVNIARSNQWTTKANKSKLMSHKKIRFVPHQKVLDIDTIISM